MKQSENPVWAHVADQLKHVIQVTNGDVGILMIGQNGAVAALIGGETESVKEMVRSLRLFRDRLNVMIEHAGQGKLHLNDDTQVFIRNDKTGEIVEEKLTDPQAN